MLQEGERKGERLKQNRIHESTFQITVIHVAVDVGKPKKTRLLIVRHFNVYQIIPEIMHSLLASLQNKLQSTSLNTDNAIKAIDYVACVVSRLDMYCTNVLMYRTMVLLARPTKVRR
jgi:hypothetical protein